MKKGFTLVELLAVIAILAIIAVITTPIIGDVLENSRKNTFKNSVQEIVNISKIDFNEYGRIGTVKYKFSNDKLVCTGCNNGSDINLEYTGKLKASGNVVITKNLTDSDVTIKLENFKNNEFIAAYNNKKVEITKISDK